MNEVCSENVGSPGNPGITAGSFTWLRNTTWLNPGSDVSVPARAPPCDDAAPAAYPAVATSATTATSESTLRMSTPLTSEGHILRGAHHLAQAEVTSA